MPRSCSIVDSPSRPVQARRDALRGENLPAHRRDIEARYRQVQRAISNPIRFYSIGRRLRLGRTGGSPLAKPRRKSSYVFSALYNRPVGGRLPRPIANGIKASARISRKRRIHHRACAGDGDRGDSSPARTFQAIIDREDMLKLLRAYSPRTADLSRYVPPGGPLSESLSLRRPAIQFSDLVSSLLTTASRTSRLL